MNRRDPIYSILPATCAFAVFFFLIIAVYSNTFNAAWQFDDKPNIIENRNLHIDHLKPQALIQSLFADPQEPGVPGKTIYRPISYLTFAVNWYFGKDKVIGYHALNILIHFLTTIFLFTVILNLLGTPNLREKFYGNRYFIAFLSAVLWAINPIQTQAVTYIVQRMASMAAMFYILSVLCYIRGRMSSSPPNRIFFLLSCALTYLLALGSKENAAMLPAALILIEFICFQDFNRWYGKNNYFWGSIAAGVIIVIIAAWFLFSDTIISSLNGYQNRPFTLAERILTEPRILLYYIGQIFYPIPTRLSIEHDVVISTSSMQPWTTLPAILLCFFLIGFGISQICKRPLIALAVLFFFLNHIIESTVIPLELIFEHRNYLPSLFLFLPIASGFKRIYDYCSTRNSKIKALLPAFMVCLIVALATATYIRNLAWATEFSLWQDAMYKAPNSARPLTNIAWQLAYSPNARASQYDRAIMFYQKALLLQKAKSTSESIIMNNIAGIYIKKGENQKAIDLLENALTISPEYNRGRHDLTKILIAGGSWNRAAMHIDYLLAKNNSHEGYLNLKGLILLHQKQYDEAIRFFRRSLTIEPFFKRTLLYLGIACSLQRDYQRADLHFARASNLPPKNIIPFLGLIENRLKVGDFKGAQKYADILKKSFDMTIIKNQLRIFSNDHLRSFFSDETISLAFKHHWVDNVEDSPKIAN